MRELYAKNLDTLTIGLNEILDKSPPLSLNTMSIPPFPEYSSQKLHVFCELPRSTVPIYTDVIESCIQVYVLALSRAQVFSFPPYISTANCRLIHTGRISQNLQAYESGILSSHTGNDGHVRRHQHFRSDEHGQARLLADSLHPTSPTALLSCSTMTYHTLGVTEGFGTMDPRRSEGIIEVPSAWNICELQFIYHSGATRPEPKPCNGSGSLPSTVAGLLSSLRFSDECPNVRINTSPVRSVFCDLV